jgi:iron(III) transport system ATP-binding protein
MTSLHLQHLSKHFGTTRAVDDVSLTATQGSRLAIVGPSGSGKTTLLRMIAGFEYPDRGSISLNGKTFAAAGRVLPAHLRGIGYVAQDGALFPHLTVADNIGFGLTLKGQERTRRIAELVEMVALDAAMLSRWPHELSGGQQQRIALARALAQQPQLMLLDEPFSALDTGLRAAMRKMVAQLLGEAGITAILVTHDQAEALSFADQLAVMRQGRLVQAGSPQQLYSQPVDEATALFLGEAIILSAHIHAGRASCALGRVAVDNVQFSGDARIMLRPEQLSLLPDNSPDLTAQARVVECDFGGHDSLVSLQLPGEDSLLQLRTSSWALPAHGSSVGLAIQGRAHLLPA